MKNFNQFIQEQRSVTESRVDTVAKTIERKLKQSGIQYTVKKNINDRVFQLDGGYKIVTDGNVIDIMKGSKDVDTFPPEMADRAVQAYEDMVG